MNTKRIVRWGVVLFLLAVLPVMTAVMAQGEEPANQMPVVTEPGVSAAPNTYNKYESEANNTRGTADPMNLGDVMGGKIGSEGDVDYFRFPSPGDGYILIDIEAISIGSDLSAFVRLFNSEGEVLTYADSLEPQDAMVFWVTETGDSPYYISVEDWYGDGGTAYNYELILSSPLLISAAAAKLGTGTVAGIPFQSQDILAHSDLNNGDEKWEMFLDGSDVGITKNVWNVSQGHRNTNGIFIGFAANQNMSGIGTVTPWDIIEFHPYKYGPATDGYFSMYLDGSAWGLTTSGEKIDALAGWCDVDTYYHGLPLSTAGASKVGNTYIGKAADEDLITYTPGGWDTSIWPMFDGSSVPGLAVEDVIATAVERKGYAGYYPSALYLTVLGNGNIGGQRVTQKDIFAVAIDSTGGHWNPNGTFTGIVWHGPDHGWNYNIDAIEWAGP